MGTQPARDTGASGRQKVKFSDLTVAAKLKLISSSGLVAALLSALFAFVLPLSVQRCTQNQAANDYIAALNATTFKESFESFKYVTPGTPAYVFSQIYVALWQAEYSAKGYAYSETPASASAARTEQPSGPHGFCYPALSSMPSGCVQFNDFQFDEFGRITDFTVDQTPVSNVALKPPQDDMAVGDDTLPFSAYGLGTLVSPGFESSVNAFRIQPRTHPDDSDYVHVSRCQLRDNLYVQHLDGSLQSRTSSTEGVVLPENIGVYAGAYGAVKLDTPGRGFVCLCLEQKDVSAQQNPCSWIKFEKGY